MELNEKLVELRKQKGLTQEELAKLLYVSRTAVSKWESGRGVPNIDSLKAISQFYTVSLDALLSSDTLLSIAQDDCKQQKSHMRDLVSGLLDCCTVLLFVLPFFAQTTANGIQPVSLLALTEVSQYVHLAFIISLSCLIAIGIATLALQNWENAGWQKYKTCYSLLINISVVLLFLICTQPYAAVFSFVMLLIKGVMLLNKP